MTQTFETGFKTVIASSLSATANTIVLKVAPSITAGRMCLKNGNLEEWIEFTGVTGTTLTGVVRGLSQTADPATAGTGLSWVAGTQIMNVAMHDQLVDKQEGNPALLSATTFATTAARDAALGGNGIATIAYVDIYVIDTGLFYNYNLNTAQWESIDTGTSPPNATPSVSGIMRTTVSPTGIPVALITDDNRYKATAGAGGSPGEFNTFETQYDTSNGSTKTATTLAFVASTKTITDSGNGLVTAGFKQGTQITITGSASNNGTFTIVSVAAGAIVVVETLVDESAGASITITSVTANKLPRYSGTSQLKVPLIPVDPEDATSKDYVDTGISSLGVTTALPFFLGAGGPTLSKTYWNYSIPFMSGTAALWTGTNVASVVSYVNWIDIATVTASNADLAYTSVVYAAPNSQYAFSSSKKIVAEFFAQCNSVGTDALAWGLAVDGGFVTPYNSAANDRVVFTVDQATSKLYAHTSGGGGTTNHTEVEITGITLTNENRYRIEFDPASEARFYVNGVLKATITTTLPNSGSVLFGVGSDYVSGSLTNRVRYFTAPNISIEK